MKKITSKFLAEFIEKNEISFLPTQPRLCVPIINRLCRKMSQGIKFDDIKTCDNLILDGHHRYLSSLIMNYDIGRVLSHKTAATKSCEWHVVEFDENLDNVDIVRHRWCDGSCKLLEKARVS